MQVAENAFKLIRLMINSGKIETKLYTANRVRVYDVFKNVYCTLKRKHSNKIMSNATNISALFVASDPGSGY